MMPFPGELKDAADRLEQQTLYLQQQAALAAGTPLTAVQTATDEIVDTTAENALLTAEGVPDRSVG